MKLFGTDTNSGMIRKISDWFEMNFNPKLSPGALIPQTVIEESQMQSISMPNFCVFDKCKTNLKINKKLNSLFLLKVR